MKRLPTDREILEAIYRRYYPVFVSFGMERGESTENEDRETKNYVPIDIAGIASELGTDADIVFGRLYYYLDRKHGYTYTRDDGALIRVPFFALRLRDDQHCMNFPLLTSVLASLQEEHWRNYLATALSVASLAIAFAAFLVSIFSRP